MPAVNPEILIWARKTAALSLEEAAKALGINDAYGQTATERLEELERGDRFPSRPQLLKMAKKYRRPLLLFYLSKPPEKGDRGQDFRTLPDAGSPHLNSNLDALIRGIKSRQSLVRSLLEDEESSALPFVGSVTNREDVHGLAERISKALDFHRNSFQKTGSKEKAFAYLRGCIESNGIFVVIVGDLGSHQTRFPVKEFRGFAIADPIAPFAVINPQDAKIAWSFTALHEVVHIWLGTTGISGPSSDNRTERFCNDVASEILLPSSELSQFSNLNRLTFEALMVGVSDFARERNISRSMVAYKLMRRNQIDRTIWQRLAYEFQREWMEARAKARKSDGASSDGPSYYVVKRHRLGKPLVGLVKRSLDDGSVTPTKASQILGVKPGNVNSLVKDTSNREEA